MNDDILMETNILKDKLREIKSLVNEVTRSDLQGIVMAEAIKLNKDKSGEIEQIFLLFCDDELNINEAKRYLLDLVDLGELENKLKVEIWKLKNQILKM